MPNELKRINTALWEMVPHDVIEAERRVADWMADKGFTEWELGYSRNRFPAISAPLVGEPNWALAREVLGKLVDLLDEKTCRHDSTHRGGAIWTICDDCGRKWADDEGGFQPYVDDMRLRAARALLVGLDRDAAPVPGNVRLTHDGAAAVDPDYYWRDMATCPRGVKVQLLNAGSVAIYALYDGSDPQWQGWAPLPKVRRKA